jgi:hypothetical protein
MIVHGVIALQSAATRDFLTHIKAVPTLSA